MRTFRLAGGALAALLILGVAQDASARRPRVDQIPNGTIFSCANCHGGGVGRRNLLGDVIEARFLSPADITGVVVWGPELAGLDADADGFTNGEELLDPEGTWRIGDPDPGDPADVTNPGDATSKPEIPTAVQQTLWGRIKALIAGDS